MQTDSDHAIVLKTPEQIEGIRKSSRAAASVLRKVSSHVVPGVTTGELNCLIDKFMRESNCLPATLGYRDFPASSCISINEVICHGIPSGKVIADGDLVKIDVTTILNGYYGDTCYTFIAGTPKAVPVAIRRIAWECMWAGVRAVKPGRRLGEVSVAVRRMADKFGVSVVNQFCGHGVGLRFHEPPNVPFDQLDPLWGPVMRQGMTFTVEPMINLGGPLAIVDGLDGWTAYTADGSLSAQFEHSVLVTESGYEVLTDWGDEKTMQPMLQLPEALCQSS